MENRKEYMKEYNKTYRQSYKGFIKYVYSHQIRNCKTRGHELPKYTEKELLDWYVNNSVCIQLHSNWLLSECDINLTPSIDRLDNSKTYSFNNIEAVTWAVNQQRARKAIQEGTLPNGGLLNNGHVPIVQYDLDGHKVAEYISIAEASRKTGIDHRKISTVCSNKKGTYKEFYWAYLKDETELISKFTSEFLQKVKKQVKTGQGFKTIITYMDGSQKTCTVTEASLILKLSPHSIRKIISGDIGKKTPKLPEEVQTITLKD